MKKDCENVTKRNMNPIYKFDFPYIVQNGGLYKKKKKKKKKHKYMKWPLVKDMKYYYYYYYYY
jgi:hypothetical protein